MPRPTDEYLATLTENTQQYIVGLEAERAAAIELLRDGGRIWWGYNSIIDERGYFLDGQYAGPDLGDVLKKAAKAMK